MYYQIDYILILHYGCTVAAKSLGAAIFARSNLKIPLKRALKCQQAGFSIFICKEVMSIKNIY